MKELILSTLSAECPWRDTLHWFDCIDSTNSEAKRIAKSAPHGTVLIAGSQTGGRGRMGRQFVSAPGGVYLSAILRPDCAPEALMHLTCAAGVAMCNAVQQLTGLRPSIKWTNDLVVGKKKLGGILTELSVNPQTGLVDYAVVGIGINCCQKNFPAPLQAIVTTLQEVTGAQIQLHHLAAAMVDALVDMADTLLSQKAHWMDAYRADCITLGQPVSVVRGEEIRHGTALNVDDNGALAVRFDTGTEIVNSGEVSVRGMYGYV